MLLLLLWKGRREGKGEGEEGEGGELKMKIAKPDLLRWSDVALQQQQHAL